MKREHLYRLRDLIRQAAEFLSDSDALDGVELFPAWTLDRAYDAGQRVRYGNKLYRCEQAHTSQSDWTPPKTPALWTEVSKPGEIPVWRQPTGSQDAYNTGDRVHFPTASDPIYSSKIDNNVWSPTEYPAGWDLETT